MPNERYSLSQLLRLILAEVVGTAEGSRRNLISEETNKLHSTFYEIKKKYAALFPPLKELHFITAGSHPYSAELTEALDRLQAGGAISRENPSFERFSRKQYADTASRMQQTRQRIVAEDAAKGAALEEIVRELEEKILVPG